MAVDWDPLFGDVHATFGEPVNYAPVAADPFPMPDGIFEDAYISQSVLSDTGKPVMMQPVLAVRLASFPGNVLPAKNDRFTLVRTGVAYIVAGEPQFDQNRCARLKLQRAPVAP